MTKYISIKIVIHLVRPIKHINLFNICIILLKAGHKQFFGNSFYKSNVHWPYQYNYINNGS